MGKNYSYVLWVPEGELWLLLDSVALSGQWSRPLLAVTLPDGQVKHWPFLRGSYTDEKSNRCQINESVRSLDISKLSDVSFDTAIYCPLDEPLRLYVERNKDWWEEVQLEHPDGPPAFDAQGRCIVGEISINIEWGWRPVEDIDAGCIRVDFTASCNEISTLFEESRSIRQTFLDLAKKHQALCCLLDRETFDSGVAVWLDGQQMEVEIPKSPDTLDEIRALVKATAPGSESDR